MINKTKKNPILFGDSTHIGILPTSSLNKYPIGNCAEVDAINNALNAGSKLKDLHITTIHSLISNSLQLNNLKNYYNRIHILHSLSF